LHEAANTMPRLLFPRKLQGCNGSLPTRSIFHKARSLSLAALPDVELPIRPKIVKGPHFFGGSKPGGSCLAGVVMYSLPDLSGREE
jgi:hypothetical protein